MRTQYKEAVGYNVADGFKVVDKCVYDVLRPIIPRPYWDEWRAAHMTAIAPPMEYISDDGYTWVSTYVVWVSVLILGLGSEQVRCPVLS